MKADDLPDDMGRWPVDPFDLLDATPTTPADALRRAYARLIRRFKPEKHPQHFQRIRDAYNQAQARSRWLPPTEEPSWTDAVRPAHEVALEVARDEAAAPQTTAWARACGGEERAVYRELQERRGVDASPETYTTLYWLLAAFPDLDAKRSPLAWALQGLLHFPGHREFIECIAHELAAQPSLYSHKEFEVAIDRLPGPEPLEQVLNLRWVAAVRQGQWGQVAKDVACARQRFGEFGTPAAFLLATALRTLAWADQAAPLRDYIALRQEVESLCSGERAFDFVLDELDFLAEVADEWRRMQPAGAIAKAIKQLLPHCARFDPIFRRLAWDFLQLLEGKPIAALKALDDVERARPLLLVFLRQNLWATFLPPAEAPHDALAIREAFANLLRENVARTGFREPLLDFLRQEGLLIEEVLMSIPYTQASLPVRQLLDVMAADTPLWLVNRALHATTA